MAKLTIEIETIEGVTKLKTLVDGEPFVALQSLSFEATSANPEPKLDLVFFDVWSIRHALFRQNAAGDLEPRDISKAPTPEDVGRKFPFANVLVNPVKMDH